MIRNYANHREAAVPEERTGIENEHLRGTMGDGESRVGSTHATIMAAEEGGDHRSFDGNRMACIMTYEGRYVYVRCRSGSDTRSLQEIDHRALHKRFLQSTP